MSSRNFRQLVVAITLIAFLGAPLMSSAAPRRGGLLGERSVSSGGLTWLWGFLGGAWTKNGCSIDPSGRCVTSSLESTDEGCMIDPSGRCVSAPQDNTKNGCLIDPNGRCITGP